jgi:ParB-like chromosome segregation protein Spo0J
MVSMGTELKIDPELEKCLPPLPEVQYQKLRASIEKKYDPAKPIVLWKERPNTIVDGHHRYKICQELGIEPPTVVESFESLDAAILYTLQRQVEQRNLTAGQLVSVYEKMLSIEDKQRLETEAKAALLSNKSRDENGVFKPIAPESASDSDAGLSREVAQRIAEKAGTNARTVYQVHAVQNKGVPEIVKMVESGEIGSGYANDFVQNIPKEKQAEIIKSGGMEAVKDVARNIRAEREEKARKERESEELKKFNEFNKTVAEKTVDVQRKMAKVFAASGGGCLMPNLSELWCDDCRWGFDVYLPVPSDPCCPYCAGTNVTKRDPEWNSREAMLK